MKDKPEKRTHPFLLRRDFGLLMVILCAAGLLFAFSSFFLGNGNEVVIKVGAEEYGRYSLSENRRISITHAGHENVVEIADGRVRMYSANCPDRLCVRQGYIDSGLYSIVCLPHQVVVEVREHA